MVALSGSEAFRSLHNNHWYPDHQLQHRFHRQQALSPCPALQTELQVRIFANSFLKNIAEVLIVATQKINSLEAPDEMTQNDPAMSSRLKTLAPELRNRIYSELLESDKPLLLVTVNEDKVHPKQSQVVHANILAACKLFYREASPILHGANKFDMDTYTAVKFLNPRNYMQIAHLRHLELSPGIDHLDEVRRILACVQHASSLEVLLVPIRWAAGEDNEARADVLANAMRNWVRSQGIERRARGKNGLGGVLRLYNGGASSKGWYVRAVERLLADKLQRA